MNMKMNSMPEHSDSDIPVNSISFKRRLAKALSAETLLNNLEEGNLYWPIQGIIIALILLGIILSGIDITSREITRIYENPEAKKYHVKKVSEIPKERENEEEKLSVEDDTLTEDDLINRYYAYVVSRIESNKVYPADEQKKGHEGSVVFKMYINKDGSVEKVTVTRQARYMELTKAAVSAIKKSVPFKPYSKRIKKEQLILNLEMRFFLR